MGNILNTCDYNTEAAKMSIQSYLHVTREIRYVRYLMLPSSL